MTMFPRKVGPAVDVEAARLQSVAGAAPASAQTAGSAGSVGPIAPITRRSLSVVLPAYNEELVIAHTVGQCAEVLSRLAPDYELIIVDDGSHDRTGAIVDELAVANPRIRVVHNRPNRGYGGALIAGFNAASKQLSFFMDADGQFDIQDIARLLRLREQGHRVVLGYRRHRHDPLIRLVNAWGWNWLVRLLYGLRVRDVDCAFKLFDTNLIRVAQVQAEGAMVNTELLVKLCRLGVPFVQVPVKHFPRQHGSATGANLRVIAHAFHELVLLRSKLHTWTAEVPPEEPPDTLYAAPAEASDDLQSEADRPA